MYTVFLWFDFDSDVFIDKRTDGFVAHVQKLVCGYWKKLQIFDKHLIETVISNSAWRS